MKMIDTGYGRTPVFHFEDNDKTDIDRCRLCGEWGPIDDSSYSGQGYPYREKLHGTVVLPPPGSPHPSAHICHACKTQIKPVRLPNFRAPNHYRNHRLAAYERRVIMHPVDLTVQLRGPYLTLDEPALDPDRTRRSLFQIAKEHGYEPYPASVQAKRRRRSSR